MGKLLDKFSWGFLLIAALALGLAPFGRQPHLLEKIGMLWSGQLSRPIDIFDLLMHGFFPVLLLIKAGRWAWLKFNRG
ncbi:MAG: hypothetical protein Kow0037_22100 [Calditrichia bacterium]